MENVSESRVDPADAEYAIQSAIFVLDCIVHREGQRQNVARAIDLYGLGSYEAAATLARAMTKGRVATPPSFQSITAPKSIDELKAMFEAVRLKRPTRR